MSQGEIAAYVADHLKTNSLITQYSSIKDEARPLTDIQELVAQEWSQISTPDVYFTQQYHEVSSYLEPDRPQAVLVDWSSPTGAVRLPLILRECAEPGTFDATSAYGYGGPWIEGSPDLFAFREYLHEWAHDNNVVTTFLRFHPLTHNARDFSAIFPVRKIGETASWNLQHSDDLVAGMASNHRRNWRRAIRSGVEARITENPESIETFRRIHDIAMERLDANSFYYFSDDYWSALVSKLGQRSIQADAVYEGRTIASVWCLLGNDYIHFHLNGTMDEARDLRGAFVAHVAAAQWGKDHGFSIAHLGGGFGGAASALLDWKHRYDPATPLNDFYVANIVHNEAAFQRMAAEVSTTDYFPPWRDPSLRQS